MIFENVRYVFLFFSINLSLITACPGQASSNPMQAFTLVITEIMADPEPPVLLPQYEYIEIFNRSETSYDLKGYSLWIGKYHVLLPAAFIAPGAYQVICDFEADSLFSHFGITLPVNMPPILNTGQVITLTDPSGEVIHSVCFSDRWYRSTEMKKGGRSLEIIDPENPCGGENNWTVSSSPGGGTPGTPNSVLEHNPDNQVPVFLRATLPSDSSILLYFSEPLIAGSLSDVHTYSVNRNLLHPDQALPIGPDFSKVLLTYRIPFGTDIVYTVTLLDTPADCAGNRISGSVFTDFALSQPPGNSDIIINEILFDATEDGAEFIELYNRSEKAIDLSAMTISLADHAGNLKKTVDLREYPFLLLSQKYAVLTTDDRKLVKTNPGNSLQVPDMFMLPDEEGMIVLADSGELLIDECYYNSNMHLDLLQDAEGVSLERVNPESLSDDPENWHSASTTSGYSTPGMPNSQLILNKDQWNISLVPEVVSPDNDGIDDFVTLHIQIGEPGWMGTIAIYNIEGRLIKSLVNNSILGTEEYFLWDGTLHDGSLAEIGLYLLYGELYSSDGKTKKFKKVVALVRK